MRMIVGSIFTGWSCCGLVSNTDNLIKYTQEALVQTSLNMNAHTASVFACLKQLQNKNFSGEAYIAAISWQNI